MSGGITNVLATVSIAEPRSGTDSAARQRIASNANPAKSLASADTVQLSEAQRFYRLHAQGQTVAQIASGLGLSVSEVDSYLALPNAA
jgi:DNA-binding CsgD family transcriptional regulator